VTTIDVAVVGASPGGLAAAREAARRGATVTLLEAGRIGHPESPAIVGFDHAWPEAIDPPTSTLRSRFERVQLAGPSGSSVEVRAPGRVADRTRLDTWLAEKAREAGARVRTETGPWTVEAAGQLACEDEQLEARVVVFADGARSLANELVDPVHAPDSLVWGVTHDVPEPPPSDEIPIRVGSHAPGGRTQLVPVDEDTTWHWTFARRPREEAIRWAEQALHETAKRRGWDPESVARAKRLHTAPDPVFQQPNEITGPRTIVTGGAAGLGGLEIGLASGRHAGQAAARALEDADQARRGYEQACRKRFAPAFEGLAQLSQLGERAPDAAIDALIEPWTETAIELVDVSGLAWADPIHRARTVLGLARQAPGPSARTLFGLARALALDAADGRPTAPPSDSPKSDVSR
jgi:flavin-dependent dehydrogenase